MGLQMRDDRQMKALTGLSQAQFDHLLPVFSDIYRTTQQQMYEEGVASGTRRRHPGGGSTGTLPTMAETLKFVLYYYKTYPTFDVLGIQSDFSVVLFRSDFVLVSEKNHMKVPKNQWVWTMPYPSECLSGATRRGHTTAPEVQTPAQ